MDDHRTRHLDAIRSKHPSLAPLINLAIREGDFTEAFVAAYFTDPNPDTKKSAVLSVMLFGDKSLRVPPTADVVAASHRGMARFIELHPRLTFDGRSSDWRLHLPRPFRGILGLRPSKSLDFFKRFALEPRFAQLDNSISVYPPLAGVLQRDLSYLDPLVQTFRLDDRPSWTTLQAHYFDTGIPALDLHNILRVALPLLEGDRSNGRAQNRIPRPLSHALGISILSIPQLLAAVDILGLAGEGLLDPLVLRGSVSRLGLLATTAANVGNRFDTLLPDLPVLLRRAASLHMLDPAHADLYAEGVSETRVGVFDTSFRFNVTRLLARGDRKLFVASPFQPFYDAICNERLLGFLLKYFEAVDPEYSSLLRAWLSEHPELFSSLPESGRVISAILFT